MKRSLIFFLLFSQSISTKLLFLTILSVFPLVVQSYQFLPSKFYLLDSLEEKSLSAHDRNLMDSTLVFYHKATHDTVRLRLLDFIIENSSDIQLWPRYNKIMFNLIEKNLLKNPHDKTILRFKASAHNNLAFLYDNTGESEKAIENYKISLFISEQIGDILGKSGTLNNLGFLFQNMGEYKRALEHYATCTQLLKKITAPDEQISVKKITATVYNNMGVIYDYQGFSYKALGYYYKSLKIRQEINDQPGVAESFFNIGSTFENHGNISKALFYYFKSLSIMEEFQDKRGIATCLNNIAFVYKGQDEKQKAIEYFIKSLKIREEIADKQGISQSLVNLGTFYFSTKDFKRALVYFQKALKIQEEIMDKSGMAYSLHNIGKVYKIEKNIPEAFNYFYRSLKLREVLQNKQALINSMISLGALWLSENRPDSAEYYAIRCHAVARDLGFPEDIRNTANLFQQIYRKQKKWEKALEMYDLHILMRDSIKNKETEKATVKQQMKYENEKAEIVRKQKEKEESRQLAVALSRRNTLQYSIIVIGLLVIGLIVALFLRLHINPKIATGLVFISLLIFFEFVLVFIDPWVEQYTGGAPVWKLLINGLIAMIIYPIHGLLERGVRKMIRQ